MLLRLPFLLKRIENIKNLVIVFFVKRVKQQGTLVSNYQSINSHLEPGPAVVRLRRPSDQSVSDCHPATHTIPQGYPRLALLILIIILFNTSNIETMSFAITSQALSLRFNKVSAKPCRASRRTLAVRMQAAHAAAPPASGEIKDKNAELAINGTCSLNGVCGKC